MKLVKQLSIFLKNSPGTLATVSEGMKDEGINILGLTVVDAVDHAVVRMVVDKPQKAIHFFGEHGLLVIDTDIVSVDLPNTAGALASLGRKLGEKNINIEYMYGSIPETGGSGLLFIKVSNIEASRALID